MNSTSEIDHLNLPDEHRLLISMACEGASKVFIAPMDKGLSSHSVWQARWELASGELSYLHIFKIGSRTLLAKEERAILDVVIRLEPNFPLMHLFTVDGCDTGLLRQDFMGDPEGQTFSLRQHLQNSQRCPDLKSAIPIIERLYLNRLRAWHSQDQSSNSIFFRQERNTLFKALPEWSERIDLHRAASEIGYRALNKSLEQLYGINLEALSLKVNAIAHQEFEMNIGPSHGDLHAQNVNIDDNLNIYLIDFGLTGILWRAIDFLMLEFALKFVVSPPHAALTDLLMIDDIAEKQWTQQILVSCSKLKNSIYGADLEKITGCICKIRSLAQRLRAIKSVKEYRMGLIFLTASLASVNPLINRIFLFHSLAKQIRLYENDV